MPERVRVFKGQCYHRLKQRCLHRGTLFQDPLFPPSAESLFYRRAPPPGLTWKRPRDLCKDPRLFVDGISSRDLHQGSLGNCWMVAATSCLATEPSLWKKVIPGHREQDWHPKRPDLYAGIFHFRFWRLGQWTDVVVDDRLPVGPDGQLLFCRSTHPREFWSALLEKAYAKLNGCYEALEGGNTAEALVDFTGGVSEPLVLDRAGLARQPPLRRALFTTLSRAHSHRALITCSIRPGEGESVESVLPCGLVRGHAYGVTALRRVRLGRGGLGLLNLPPRLHMIRMRNPWGTADWNGAWGHGSPEWQQVSRSEREKMGVTVRDDGEFWMEFDDFCRFFTDVVVCRRMGRALLCPRPSWREARSYGEWAEESQGGGGDQGGRCGGCINNRDTFLNNPQFMFDVQREGDEVLICLQQEDKRAQRREGAGENLPIGFEVLKVEMNRQCRVRSVCEQAISSVYMDSRSVFLRAELSQGRHVIVPTTFNPGGTGRFLLRLFTETHANLRELKDELPPSSVWCCCVTPACRVTTVNLRRANGLGVPKCKAPDVFAVLRCEGSVVRSRVFRAASAPEFNLRAIFYRRDPERHISVEVWARGRLTDSLLGCVRVPAWDQEKGRSRVMDLLDGQSQHRARGRVYIETSSSECLTDL
ncbi:calpain-5 [Amia ocellicauda]|uniref:calpain-5 n=1 Tax=Amia ocellicauda TaxID=2972642 RepID=UPI00346393E3